MRELDLVVEEGEVFGFLGPNGAGKSTTINVLLDYVRPTGGSAELLGMDAHAEGTELHDRIGVLPENLALWDRLPAREHVRLVARTKAADVEPSTALERVGLGDVVDEPVGEFSTGMTQRLGLAMALVGDPELLILDEPTAGLDPNGVRRLREIIDEEVDRGATVFFSSHVLDQVEAVCDRVGILRDGKLVAVDTIEGLRERAGVGQRLLVELATPHQEAVTAVEAIDNVAEVDASGGDLEVTCTTADAKLRALDVVRDAGATVEDFDVETADLEALFAAYAGENRTGEPAPDGARTGGTTPEGAPTVEDAEEPSVTEHAEVEQ